MASDYISLLKENVAQAKAHLAELDKVITILSAAGEDTTQQRADYMNTKAKLERFERALNS